MNQTFRKIISFFLLATFLVATTPDDLIHLLTNHHDTVDSNSPVSAVSVKHIHCQALQLTLPSFIKTEKGQLPGFNHLYSSLIYEFVSDYQFRNDIHLPSRAPPTGV